MEVIYAVAKNGAFGRNGGLPWNEIRLDILHFATTTQRTKNPEKRNALIMGRRTYESIPERRMPLTGRMNIVVTSQPDMVPASSDTFVAESLDAAYALARSHKDVERVFVMGGVRLIAEALERPETFRQYVTFIDHDFPADVTAMVPHDMPDWRVAKCSKTSEIPVKIDEQHVTCGFCFTTFVRRGLDLPEDAYESDGDPNPTK